MVYDPFSPSSLCPAFFTQPLLGKSLSVMSCFRSPVRLSLSLLEVSIRGSKSRAFSSVFLPSSLVCSPPLSKIGVPRIHRYGVPTRPLASMEGAVSVEAADFEDKCENPLSEPLETSPQDTVQHLLTHPDDVSTLMKMERKSSDFAGAESSRHNRWFPYLDKFRCETADLNSLEVLEAVGPYILESRKERFRNAVENRSYSVCLVVEGLSDFGNVSAAFRSADALGFQSVHVVSCDSSKRYRENRHVSMGAEKWLDIEIWNSTSDCFRHLKSRGYRIATTHLGVGAVSIHDMDWSCPTAIVVGNEGKGISDEAVELSDLHCIIPMKGMVDSFNVSVAAGILMHHAVCDRISRLGRHGDLSQKESQILLAEFYLRHSKSATRIADEYAIRKAIVPTSKL